MAVVWLIIVVGGALWLLLRIASGPVIDADLLSLLPRAAQAPAVQAAADKVISAQERRLLLVVSAVEESAARKAAQSTYEALAEGGLFDRLELRSDLARFEGLGRFYFPHRFQLLSEDARRLLLSGDEKAFERHLLLRYLSPLGSPGSSLIEADPLLLLPDFLSSLRAAQPSKIRLKEGFLTVQDEDGFHVLIVGVLAASPFSVANQEALGARLREARAHVAQQNPKASLMVAGVFPYAAAGTEAARREISIVGSGSLLGILLLFLAVFRSLRPFLMAGLAIASGCLAGFVSCFAIFGEVHLLTLVFGASLVGISVDYAFHYFCAALDKENSDAGSVLGEIFPGITLGLLTSIIGFSGILLGSFPGLREMAVFSSFGLVAAWLSVVLLFPLLRQEAAARPSRALSWASTCARLWSRSAGATAFAGCGIVVLILAAGAFNLTPLNDFRLLQAHDRVVQAEEQRVRALLGQAPARQFFLVAGADAADLLENEEALTTALSPLLENGEVTGYTALSRFVPSPARQQVNRALIRGLLSGESSPFDLLEDQLGLPESLRTSYEDAFAATAAQPPLMLADWLASPVSASLRELWLDGRGGVFSAVMLTGRTESAVLREIAEKLPAVHLIDRVGELSGIFSTYRDQALWLTLASYIVVAVVLALRYGLKGACSVMAVPLTAGLVAFGALGYLSEPISLFNVMALLLILGIGVDYAIFFREAGAVKASTLLAVALSALTTLLAFGLLSVSATMAVHSFGLTLLIGIAAAFLLAPIGALLIAPQRKAHLDGAVT
ncbi:MMPL family transporter [Pelagibius marinus]|uniref:MMPL family transporter n=1 Tax=Pelagibius marinus TaxID=2762760 RepID=UPI0018732F13|nr:hypothetical protein [Pelagibius marinus]